MLDRRQERDRLLATLNGGSAAGWNDDEPAVVQAAFELVLKRHFDEYPDEVKLSELLELVSATLIADSRTSDAPEAGDLIRSALGGDSEPEATLPRLERFRLQAVVVGLASMKMQLGETEVDAVLRESERVAFERGFHPPLVPRGRHGAERS